MKNIFLIGAGPDGKAWMTLESAKVLADCDLLIGAQRLLDAHPGHPGAKVTAVAVEEVRRAIEAHPKALGIAVLLSGDTGFYSGAKRLQDALGADALTTLPGISAHQLLCARLGVSWDDACLVSVHGRARDVCAAVLCHPKTLVLTGGNLPPQAVCAQLFQGGLGFVAVTVGEKLGYAGERIRSGEAQALQTEEFDPLSVLLIENQRPLPEAPIAPGLPDDAFLRAKAPMTKREVRAVSVAQMHLRPSDVVWDVGAGTGSVAIECALLCRKGRVFAVERDAQACEGIRQNREKFGAWHLTVVKGEAPQALSGLPAPDRAFIGGSGGRLGDILQAALQANPDVRVVINAVTLETLFEALDALKALRVAGVEITQVSASRARPVGAYRLMTAQNPVFILAGGGA